MTYKLVTDTAYQVYFISLHQANNALGSEYKMFSFRPEPKPYSHIWQPFTINFSDSSKETKKNPLPDLSVNQGRLFLSEKAHQTLNPILNDSGEFLPIQYDNNQRGYIFNPLITAENINAINNQMVVNDIHKNLKHISFDGSAVKETLIFKSLASQYLDIYCNQEFKEACEQAQLTGIRFNNDLASLI